MSVDLDTLDNISQKIIDELKSELTELKKVDLYEGQFDEDPPKIVNHLPAAFVNLADVSPGEKSEDGAIVGLPLTWDLYIAAKNLRSVRKNKRTLWGLILGSVNILQGNDLDSKHSYLDFTDAEQMVNLPGIIVYRVSFKQTAKV